MTYTAMLRAFLMFLVVPVDNLRFEGGFLAKSNATQKTASAAVAKKSETCGYDVTHSPDRYQDGLEDCMDLGCCCHLEKADFIEWGELENPQIANGATRDKINYGECADNCLVSSKSECYKIPNLPEEFKKVKSCRHPTPNSAEGQSTCGAHMKLYSKTSFIQNKYTGGVQACQNKQCCCFSEGLKAYELDSLKNPQCADVHQRSVYNYAECPASCTMVSSAEECYRIRDANQTTQKKKAFGFGRKAASS